MKENNSKYPFYLLGIFTVFWLVMAIDPNYRYMWFIENVLMLIFMSVLIFTYKKFKFSNVSYTFFFLFLVLQTIGAHYTYAEVPFGLITDTFGFERNHFDRVVHFSFGFLLVFPFREFFIRTSHMRNKFYSYYVPVEWAFAMGAIYEVIEWAFAVMSDPNAGGAFLGSQGDIWDAQWDMFLAGLGAMITMFFTYLYFEFFRKNSKKRLK